MLLLLLLAADLKVQVFRVGRRNVAGRVHLLLLQLLKFALVVSSRLCNLLRSEAGRDVSVGQLLFDTTCCMRADHVRAPAA